MVHLPALPGSANSQLSLDAVVEHAQRDASALQRVGFGAVLIENFGDAPFTPGSLEPVTVAAMAVVVHQVRTAASLLVGVNCLRNDARSALGIAAACGGDFIRVNVHTGVVATDQGMIEGRAHDTLRDRQRLRPGLRIFADVHVKHATPVSQPDIALAAEETAYRGQADAVIVSGATTGRAADMEDLRRVKAAVPDKLLLIGSGASASTIKSLLAVADGAIVGSCLKPSGDASQPIDPHLAAEFVGSI
jgi:membrane complex biogenesis BtpA family protein